MQVCKNGVSIIAHDRFGRIPFMLQNYSRDPKWILGGGGIEETDESAEAAAVREFHEEFGVWIRKDELVPVAKMVQLVRVDGHLEEGELHLFASVVPINELRTQRNEEVADAGFFSIGQIFSEPERFGLGYRRMVLQYLRCVDGLDPIPFGDNGTRPRLSNPIRYPALNLDA